MLDSSGWTSRRVLRASRPRQTDTRSEHLRRLLSPEGYARYRTDLDQHVKDILLGEQTALEM
jgi:hypothetical protein